VHTEMLATTTDIPNDATVEAMPLSSVKGRTTNDATHSAPRTLDVSDKNVIPVSAAAKAV
jgi:hypothetical protein